MTATRLSPPSISEAALNPSITIVVSPQEHSGCTQQSLDSIYKHTKVPFELVYVDAGSPKHIQTYLTKTAARHSFTLLRCEHALTPNQARNLGLSQVKTDYIVFLSNDICVSPGWLEKLWQCAQKTNAAAIYPVTYVGTLLDEHIHPASDKTRILMDIRDEHIHRYFYEKPSLASCSTPKEQSYRQTCEFAKLNCLLVKRNIIEQIGYLDPILLGPQADLDFSLNINRIDEQVFCETAAAVTYVPQKPKHWLEWYCFSLRWSDAWELESLMHFHRKWDLDMDYYFHQYYRYLGQHRHQAFLYPLLQQLTRGNIAPWAEQLAIDLERWVNQTLTDRHAKLSYDAIANLVPTTAVSTQSISLKQMLQQVFAHNNSTTASQPYLSQ